MTLTKIKKTTGKTPKGLGMPTAKMIHSFFCKIFYDRLSDITMKETNKLSRMNLDREAPVYRWGMKGEVKPDVAYFTSIERIEDSIDAAYKDPLFEIEVVDNHGKKGSYNNIKKVFKEVTSMKEAFLYNYETKEWTRYTPSKDTEPKSAETDYSSIFKVHLNTLLTNQPHD